MKRIISTLILALSISLATVAFGADGVKLGFVDFQKVLSESEAGKEAMTQLAGRANKYKGEQAAREEELKKLKTELEKQTIVLSDDARKAKEQNFMQKRKDLDRFLKAAEEDLQEKKEELVNRLGDEIVKTIQVYGKTNNYTSIIVKNQLMIYVDEKSDLTEEVIKAFNAVRKK